MGIFGIPLNTGTIMVNAFSTSDMIDKDDHYINYVGGFTSLIDELAKKIFLKKVDITFEYVGEAVTKEQCGDN
jgi:hypothetical protein